MLLAWFLGSALAAPCPLKEANLWSHYADEWGHEEKPVQILKRQNIKIGQHRGQWVLLPKTCTKQTCDVSFLLEVSKDCWKPHVSVQGKSYPSIKGDWQKFELIAPRSSIDKSKSKKIIWQFNEKTLNFEILPSKSK